MWFRLITQDPTACLEAKGLCKLLLADKSL